MYRQCFTSRRQVDNAALLSLRRYMARNSPARSISAALVHFSLLSLRGGREHNRWLSLRNSSCTLRLNNVYTTKEVIQTNNIVVVACDALRSSEMKWLCGQKWLTERKCLSMVRIYLDNTFLLKCLKDPSDHFNNLQYIQLHPTK